MFRANQFWVTVRAWREASIVRGEAYRGAGRPRRADRPVVGRAGCSDYLAFAPLMAVVTDSTPRTNSSAMGLKAAHDFVSSMAASAVAWLALAIFSANSRHSEPAATASW